MVNGHSKKSSDRVRPLNVKERNEGNKTDTSRAAKDIGSDVFIQCSFEGFGEGLAGMIVLCHDEEWIDGRFSVGRNRPA